MLKSRVTAWCAIAAMLVAGGVPCAGWQPSAQARHDCCASGVCPDRVDAAGHAADVSQSAADQCCGTSETRQQHQASQVTSVSFALPPLVLVSDVPHTAIVVLSHPPRETVPIAARSAPLHILLSVFLI